VHFIVHDTHRALRPALHFVLVCCACLFAGREHTHIVHYIHPALHFVLVHCACLFAGRKQTDLSAWGTMTIRFTVRCVCVYVCVCALGSLFLVEQSADRLISMGDSDNSFHCKVCVCFGESFLGVGQRQFVPQSGVRVF